MTKERLNIYWGLLVSVMVNLILPWKFSISRGANNMATKLNFAGQQFVMGILLFLVVWSFFREVRTAMRAKRRHFIRIALRRWWTNY
jgi:hypothetical protein